MSDSRDYNQSTHKEPRDGDGGLLLLGMFAGIGVLSVLVAAGYGIFALVMDDDTADLAAVEVPVSVTSPPDSVPPTPDTPDVPLPSLPSTLVASQAVAESPQGQPVLPQDGTTPSDTPTVVASATDSPEVPPAIATVTPPSVAGPDEPTPRVIEPVKPASPVKPNGDVVASVTPEAQPTEPAPAEPDPAEPTPAEPTPVEPRPAEPKPTDPKPAETAPAESDPPAVTTVVQPKLPEVEKPVKPAPPASAGPHWTQGRPLVYLWGSGEIHSYGVTLSTATGGNEQVVTGTVELTIQETPPQPVAVAQGEAKDDEDDDTEMGTGTGFVVSADGYLMTCAHVVQGANKIEVQLGGQKYEATVVAVEPDDDLALIRIDAQDLSPLSLADSDKVKLGEEIRAVGFPLSSVLGEGLKVTRGTVAGIVQRENGKRLQVDAAINPGNSGGPIVNAQGHVLGVASSKLVGLELTGVGFCVPAERARALMAAHQVKPVAPAANAAKPTGPEVVAAVSPSVALISVSVQSVKASGELVRIRTSGSFRTKREQDDPRRRIFSPFASLSNYTSDRGSLNVDSRGHVASFEAPNQLPFLAGPMAMLAIHPFDPSGRSSWTVRESITVTIQDKNDRFGGLGIPRVPIPRGPRGFGRAFGPRGFNPFGARDVKKMTALEVHQYRVKSDSDDEVLLEKTFSLTTLDDEQKPYFHITGNGNVKFSRVTGLVESFEFEHNFTQNGGEKRVHVPVKIKVEREPPQVVAKRKRDLAIQMAKAEWENAQKAAIHAARPAGEVLDEVLVRLHDEIEKEKGNVRGPIGELKKLKVIPERKVEVEKFLLRHLVSEDRQLRTDTIGALSVWGTSECVPDLVGLISHADRSTATAAMAALGAIGDERAVDPLLDKLSNLSFQRDAQTALGRLGAPAEEAVLAKLAGADRNTARVLCDVLQQVGGEKSLKVLEEMAASKDFFLRAIASRVVRTVRSRVETLKSQAVPEGQTLSNADVEVAASLDKLAAGDTNDVERLKVLVALGSIEPSEFKRDDVEAQLIALLEHPNAGIRQQSLVLLMKWATDASAASVLKVALQPGSAQRSVALQILSRVGTQAEADALVDLMIDPELSQHPIGLVRRTGLGPAAEQQLGSFLQGDLSAASKLALITLLGDVGTAASLVPLDAVADAPQASTMQFAAARAAAKLRLRTEIPFSS